MLGSPLAGRIQAQGEVWQGSPTFRVTSTFAEHVASGRGPGIDFGNGQCGAEVYACEAGQIVAAFVDAGNGAVIVRIRHPQLGNVVTGYAHLQSIEVGLVPVSRGQVIGHVGATGADACHLHWGVNIDGAEVDGWPLLDQNIMEPDVTLKGTPIEWITNRTTVLPGGATFLKDPTLTSGYGGTANSWGTLTAAMAFTPLVRVSTPNGNHLGGWSGVPGTSDIVFGYIGESAARTPFVPIETVEVPGPPSPPVIIEVPSTEPPPPTDVATAKAVLLAAGIDIEKAKAELVAQTTDLNTIATARNTITSARTRAVTRKNNARIALGG